MKLKDTVVWAGLVAIVLATLCILVSVAYVRTNHSIFRRAVSAYREKNYTGALNLCSHLSADWKQRDRVQYLVDECSFALGQYWAENGRPQRALKYLAGVSTSYNSRSFVDQLRRELLAAEKTRKEQRDKEQAAARVAAEAKRKTVEERIEEERAILAKVKAEKSRSKRAWLDFTTDQAGYYMQDVTLIGDIFVSDYFNYEFADRDTTHFSFEISDGNWFGKRIHGYARKADSSVQELREALLQEGSSIRGSFTVRSVSQENDGCVALIGWSLWR